MKKIFELKERIKLLVIQQKDLRPQRKLHYTGKREVSQGDAISCMRNNKYELRHLHVAYCLLRGRTIEQIEPKTCADKCDHLLSMSYVNKLMEAYREPITDTAVAAS